MAVPLNVVLGSYDAQVVLLPGKGKKSVRGVRITIYGDNFPQRAPQPRILVGEKPAAMVTIAPDQRSIRGFFLKAPPEDSVIRVVYANDHFGELRERFTKRRVRPLPKTC
jgi:hypothetical protein